MKQMFSFSGWMIFGCCTDLLNGQGVNILINIFFGPIYNASRAIAMQVQTAIAQFSANFILSVNPQITKSYAAKEYDSCYRLVYLASKMSIFLMMFMIIPVILHSYTILNLWLGDVPSEANLFVNLILINYLVRSTYSPIAQINQAYGKVKLYQLLISLLYIVNFAGSYWLFKIGFPVISTFVLSIVISIIGLAVRLWVLHYQVQFPSKDYFYNVVVRSLIVLCITYAVCWLVKDISSHEIVNLLISCVLSIITSALTIWFIGFNKSERNGISHYALSKLAILRKFKH
jgi:O-antigen/teichoic acid export membrane protein